MEWRKLWFEFVQRIKKKNKCSHREAMSIASGLWPKEKEKLKRKKIREDRKALRTINEDS